MFVLPDVDNLDIDVFDTLYVETGTEISQREALFGVIPGNILGSKLNIKDYDWGVVAPKKYRDSINSLHLPIRNKGFHILDPEGNGKMVGLYENIIPGEVYVDWINLIMPRIATLDLYVSPSMFSMMKDVSKGKTDLMPHEHHMMTIWPRSWQGNNFLLTRGRIFETEGDGYVELDGFLDGMELPMGLNDGIIHGDVKLKSMRRITSKMTIGAIHNNLVWNFTNDAIAHVPTISRPYGPTVMGQPFRHVKNMPRSIEYVKEEWEEYVIGFSSNKAYRLDLHSFTSHMYKYYQQENTSFDFPWKVLIERRNSTYSSNFEHNFNYKDSHTASHVASFLESFWDIDSSYLSLDNYQKGKNNFIKHLSKMNYGIIPIAMTQHSRYRSEDVSLFKWGEGDINLNKFTYLPYNVCDYSTYKTGSHNDNRTKLDKASPFNSTLAGNKIKLLNTDSGELVDHDAFGVYSGVVIDNKFMGIHNVRKLFPDDANITIDKLVIPWLEESYNGDNLIKYLDVAPQQHQIKKLLDLNPNELSEDILGDNCNKYSSKGADGLLMSVPLDYALNGAVVGNYDDLKKKWNYQGSPMIFKRKGGATQLGRVGLPSVNYTNDEKEEILVFYCPYKIPKRWIDENKIKLRVGLICEETFKQEMHTGNGNKLSSERLEHVSLDPSGRDFLYPNTLNSKLLGDPNTITQKDKDYTPISMSNYFFDVTDNIMYGKSNADDADITNAHIARCHAKRDYLQPVPAHKHPSELLKPGQWKFMRMNNGRNDDQQRDVLNLAYDRYEEYYYDYYNLASDNLGGSNRQLISYPKNVMMLSFASDMGDLPHTPDTTSADSSVESTFDKFNFEPQLSSIPRTGDVPDMLIEEYIRQTPVSERACLTRIVIKDPMLVDAYKKAGPDASVIAISNIPLFLEGASYIGGTFPPESEYQELIDQRTPNITDSFFVNGANAKLDTITPTYENMKAGCFNKLSTGFELDDVFLENSQLFRHLSVFMQETSRYHNVMYRVNPHILEPMYRKGMTEFFGDITVKMRPDLKARNVIFEDHRGSNNFGRLNEGYEDLLNIPGQYDSRVGFWKRYEVTFPFINLRWCMQFAFDDMPKTITTIKGINLLDTTYVPDNLFPEQVTKVVLNPAYIENEVNLREYTYKSMLDGAAIWINEPCKNPNAIIEHNDLFKSMLVFTRDKDNPMYKEPLEEYYEWSIDNKVDGIQYNAQFDRYKMYYERRGDISLNSCHDAPFDMRLDEFIDFYSNWVVMDSTVTDDSDIKVRWEIDLITKNKKDLSFVVSNRLDVEYIGKAGALKHWNGLGSGLLSGPQKSMVEYTSGYYIGSPVVKSIRVYSDVYVCPSPNWERGIWGILRGTLPKGADTRCVVIPQRCTEGIFYRDVDLSRGIVLGEYNGSLPEKLFWGTDKKKLNISGIFASTHNSNPHSHRTRKQTLIGYNNSEDELLLKSNVPYLHLTSSDENILIDKHKEILLPDEKHKVVNNKYRCNMYKLNTPFVMIDDDASTTIQKIELSTMELNSSNQDIWRMCKRIQFGTHFIIGNKENKNKSYVANYRPSVTTVNDVSPLCLPHKFDEIDISRLGGFGDLHEFYSDDLFGITPYAYATHRPIGTYNRGYTNNTIERSSISNWPLTTKYMILLMIIHNIHKNAHYSPGDNILNGTIYGVAVGDADGNIGEHERRLNIKPTIPSYAEITDRYSYYTEDKLFGARDKRKRRLGLSEWSAPFTDIDLNRTLDFINRYKKHLLKADGGISEYLVNFLANSWNHIPRNYEDIWMNFTGKNIFDEMFRSTGDTAFPITQAIPVTSIFNKYTMLNAVAKTKNRDDYVFSEHRCGVLYDFYDRFVSTRFNQTEFDQSYYIIQSNIRRSNIYKVYHQGIDYKRAELYRFAPKSEDSNRYDSGSRLQEILDRLYHPINYGRTPNIRSVYTHGGENCTNRYSRMSMYYRSTLINETVGDILEVGSTMPLVGPLYYNLYQNTQIEQDVIGQFKPDFNNLGYYKPNNTIIMPTLNNKYEPMVAIAMNRTLGLTNISTRAYGAKNTLNGPVRNTIYLCNKRGGIYKTIREVFDVSPNVLVSSIINHYRHTILKRDPNDNNDANLKFDTRFPFTKVHSSSIKLPEYYSNWSNGGYNATCGHALYHDRNNSSYKNVKAAELYPAMQNLFLLKTDVSLKDYRNSFVGNKYIFKYNGLTETPTSSYPSIDVQMNAVANLKPLLNDKHSSFGENLTVNGLIYRADFSVHHDIGSSLLLNTKSYASLMRIGGGKRNIYHRFLYPSSDNYLSLTRKNQGYVNTELPYRFDTNHHIVLSNIQSINSQAGDLDEVCYFEDVSSMVSNLVFTESMINVRGIKGCINTPAVISPFLKSIEVAAMQQYDSRSKLFQSYGSSSYLKDKSPLDIHTLIVDARVTHVSNAKDTINSTLPLARNFDPNLLTDSTTKTFYNTNGITRGTSYALETEHMYPNYGPIYYKEVEVDLDLFMRPVYLYPFLFYSRNTHRDIKKGLSTAGHKKYIEMFNKRFMPSEFCGILKLPLSEHHVSPNSGRMLYRYSYNEPYQICLSNYPCLNDITMDRNNGMFSFILGRNRITDIRAIGVSYRGKNMYNTDLGRFNIIPVVPDKIWTNPEYTFKYPRTTSAWVNTDTVQRCSNNTTHEITIYGQFLQSHVSNYAWAAQAIHRTCGKANGYPEAGDGRRPLLLNIKRMCSFTDMTPNMKVSKNQSRVIGKNSNKASVTLKYNKATYTNTFDIYSTFLKFMQHKPTNANQSNIWEAPNDRIGNGLAHIKSMHNIFEFMSIPIEFNIGNPYQGELSLAKISNNNANKLGGEVLVFNRSPLYMSRPLYINNTTIYNNLFEYSIVDRTATPKMYDLWNGSGYSTGSNNALIDAVKMVNDYPPVSGISSVASNTDLSVPNYSL